MPPGPSSPGVAQTLAWMYRPIPFIERARERYGQLFSLNLGPRHNTIVVADPDLAREVITGDPEIFRAGDANGIMRPVVGPNSLLVLDGETHMRHRRILLPGFDREHSRAFQERVTDIAAYRIADWRPGDELRLQDEMEAISFEAILSVVFGQRRSRLDEFRRLVPEMMARCASPFTLLPYFRRELGGVTPYARLRRTLDQLDELFYAEIAEQRVAGVRPGDGALALLVAAQTEEGTPLTDEAIRDEILTLIMAGYETTTSALAWSFERLLRSPEALEKLIADLDGDGEYLDAVIKESLRARPVVPVVARKVSEDVEVGGQRIPAGTVLMVSVYLLHRDPSVYSDPDSFRPERFTEGTPEGAVWIPFGGGTRRCLGARFAELEMQIVLRAAFERVRLSAPDPRPEPVTRKRFTFAPGRGARARVEELAPTPA